MDESSQNSAWCIVALCVVMFCGLQLVMIVIDSEPPSPLQASSLLPFSQYLCRVELSPGCHRLGENTSHTDLS